MNFLKKIFKVIKNHIARSQKKTILLYIFIFMGISVYFLTPPVYLMKDPNALFKIAKKNSNDASTKYEEMGPNHEQWAPISDIAISFPQAVLSSEDARFYSHFGIDFKEILSSFKLNIKQGRYARGGSTITQQVVRTLFLSNDKNLIRKIREIFGAVALEFYLDKNQILEWYLNILHLGEGIYGVKEASLSYFNIDPIDLDISQSIQLAMILPNPITWGTGLRQKQLTEFGEKRFVVILDKMYLYSYITKDQREFMMHTGNFGYPLPESDIEYLEEDIDN